MNALCIILSVCILGSMGLDRSERSVKKQLRRIKAAVHQQYQFWNDLGSKTAELKGSLADLMTIMPANNLPSCSLTPLLKILLMCTDTEILTTSNSLTEGSTVDMYCPGRKVSLKIICRNSRWVLKKKGKGKKPTSTVGEPKLRVNMTQLIAILKKLGWGVHRLTLPPTQNVTAVPSVNVSEAQPTQPQEPVEAEVPAKQENQEPAQPPQPAATASPKPQVVDQQPPEPEAEPSEPAKPSENAQPPEPAQQPEKVQPAKLAQPPKIVQPAKPAQPSEEVQVPEHESQPVHAVRIETNPGALPNHHEHAAESPEEDEAVEPSEQVQPAEQANQEQPSELVVPSQPEEDSEPAEPVQAVPSAAEPAAPAQPVAKSPSKPAPANGNAAAAAGNRRRRKIKNAKSKLAAKNTPI